MKNVSDLGAAAACNGRRSDEALGWARCFRSPVKVWSKGDAAGAVYTHDGQQHQ